MGKNESVKASANARANVKASANARASAKASASAKARATKSRTRKTEKKTLSIAVGNVVPGRTNEKRK